MALIKKHLEFIDEELPIFSNLEEAIEFFKSNDDLDKKYYVIEEISKLEGGYDYLISYLAHDCNSKDICSKISTVISSANVEDVPIKSIMDLLKLKNAYIRNIGMSILSYFGDSMKDKIVEFLRGDDRNLRIYAVNILGDVNFAESRNMLLELLKKEQDINVAMTAVDYMGEIGELADIPLLESLKERFKGDFYAEFALDNAIKLIRG
jgi:hypothetical protein